MNKIIIFYHAFLENHWLEIFLAQIETMKKAGLYEAMTEMRVGVVWKEKGQLEIIKDLISKHDKINIFYDREFDIDPPFGVNKDASSSGIKDNRFKEQLAESETILRMPEHAKGLGENCHYFFFHTKGVSDRRRLISIQRKKIKGMIKRVTIKNKLIRGWKKHCEVLKEKDYVGSTNNFWWANSNFIAKFDIQKYLEAERELLTTGKSRIGRKLALPNCDDWQAVPKIRKDKLKDRVVSLYRLGVGDPMIYVPNDRHVFSRFVVRLENSLIDGIIKSHE